MEAEAEAVPEGGLQSGARWSTRYPRRWPAPIRFAASTTCGA